MNFEPKYSITEENAVTDDSNKSPVTFNFGTHKPRIKIAFVSQPEYFRFIYENELNSFAEVFEFRLRMNMQPSDFNSLIAFQADYNFIFRGEYIPDVVLRKINGLSIALSSEPFPRIILDRVEFTNDSILRYLLFRGIRNKPFDYVFHYDAASLPLFTKDQLFISGQFPFPVATTVYHPSNRSKEWDIFFIGRSSAHRERHFNFLKHRYNFLHICHGVYGAPLVDYICSAKICLNIHAEKEVSWEPRIQMMLACGAFVISEKITPNSYLRPGIDYVEISSRQELENAVAYYLQNESARLQIARNGYERVRTVLDSKTCFQQLISDLEGERLNKFKVGKGILVFDILSKALRIWAWSKCRLIDK